MGPVHPQPTLVVQGPADLPDRPLDVWLGMGDVGALIAWSKDDVWRVERVLFGDLSVGQTVRVDDPAAVRPSRVGCPVLLVANRQVDGLRPVEPRGLLFLQPDGSMRFDGDSAVVAAETPASAGDPARVVLTHGLPTNGRVLSWDELVARVDAHEPSADGF